MRNRLTLFLVAALFVFAASPLFAESLMMATTTSTDNTGLLDELAPRFEEDTGIELKWTSTGTGKALELGKNCDVDVLLVHAPAAEKKYIADGYGTERVEVMYNDFVIIGPASDPAKVEGMSVVGALEAIAGQKAGFVSRGDDSGTHKKEQSLWQAADRAIPEKEAWYLQAGQGMIATINVAEERSAYTMTDRGTYIKYESNKGGDAPLKILVEGDEVLLNQYSVIPVSPKNCPDVQHDLAVKFADWMASDRAQKLIGDFKLLGKQLFTPNAK